MKKVLLVLLVILVIIQFIHPAKNSSSEDAMLVNDISKKYIIPQNVHDILKTSCYDCHSNNTVYPWYSKIQPVDWWLTNHINEGKREVNFSEFAT
ncbi:MAG: cytochrome [Ferruginibacter sp.]|uniref:heme-binding domain-containing protein n=1 Tax=Ferruginibacter sp. TaxID=1940288 RepID=UPI0026594AEE|nr:heme-binding domain-containing protein [Ferruginibacter sp.]MDB5275156.1 cytochrome [Ferruginibacter sp.]